MRAIGCFVCVCLLLLSCHNSSRQRRDLAALDKIDAGIVDDPQRAMRVLDSIRDSLSTDYVVRMKWALLRTKAQDKSYIPLGEDSMMRDVLEFFEENGSEEEKLEAYYYTAGVFRDQHNMAQALRWYKKARDFGYDNIENVDTGIVSGIGSNLAYIYMWQMNFRSALNCLKDNYKLTLPLSPKNHYRDTHELAIGYKTMFQCHPEQVAYKDSAYYLYTENLRLYQEGVIPLNLETISNSLGFYAEYNFEDEARSCLELLRRFPEADYPPTALVNMGYYYRKRGDTDSTLYYWKLALQHSPSALFRGDATYYLTRTHHELGQKDSALHYAMQYLDARDTIELQLMREQTLTANNEYNYNRGREMEERLKRQNAEQWIWLLGIVSVSLSILLIVIYTMYRKYRSVVAANDWLRSENARTKEHMAHVALVAQKKRNELNMNISNVAAVFRNFAEEEQDPDEEVWRTLITSVQNLFPNFQERITAIYPDAATKDIKTLYMLKAGLKKADIAKILGMGRSGISNRIKHIEQKLGCKWEDL